MREGFSLQGQEPPCAAEQVVHRVRKTQVPIMGSCIRSKTIFQQMAVK